MQKALIVNVGGIGAALNVADLASDKIISVIGLGAGDSLEIEVSTDGVNFNSTKTFTQAKSTQHLKYPALAIRANATNAVTGGITASVEADLSAIQSAIIPTPALNAIGASIDISELGSLSTLSLNNLAPVGSSIRLEASNDDVNYHTVLVFTEDDAVVKNVNQKFIRAVSLGASAASLSLSSEDNDAAISALAPVTSIVWRPEATGNDAPGGNIYTTWEDAYAAIERVRFRGTVNLEFDGRFSTIVVPMAGSGMLIPAGTADNGAAFDLNGDGKYSWDMRNVIWKNHFIAFGSNPGGNTPAIFFQDSSVGPDVWQNGLAETYIDNLSNISFDFSQIWHNGTIHTPIRGSISIPSGRTDFLNTVVGAKAIIGPDSTPFVPFVIGSRSGAANFDRSSSLSPVVDGAGKFTLIVGCTLRDDCITNPGGFTVFIPVDTGSRGLHQWIFPNMGGPWVIDVGTDFHGGVWQNMTDVLTANALARYNQIVLVDPTAGDFAIDFPTATRVAGEVITVVAVGAGGGVGFNEVTFTPFGAEAIDNPTIKIGDAPKTYRPDGSGTMRQVSGALGSVVLNNLAAAVAPLVGDDETLGYEVGSQWVDTVTGTSYICVDASVGAAVWKDTSTDTNINTQLEALPEKWFQDDVAASQADVDLGTKVSVTFPDVKAIQAGSIVGLSTRLNDAITDATADSAIVTVTINGVEGTLAVSHASGGNASGGEAVQAAGVDTYVAGDLIGVSITTLASFLPITTDLEAWLEVAPS